MDANKRECLLRKTVLLVGVLEKYQVSGFQVSGVRAQSFLVTCHFGLPYRSAF
jgi:hypothetical protein